MGSLVIAAVLALTPAHATCSEKCKRRVLDRQRREIIAPYRPWLARLRACESGGNYRIVDTTGRYKGAYQFDDQTWRSVGGEGQAHRAPRLEQDYRAVRLRKARGTAPWPVCG